MYTYGVNIIFICSIFSLSGMEKYDPQLANSGRSDESLDRAQGKKHLLPHEKIKKETWSGESSEEKKEAIRKELRKRADKGEGSLDSSLGHKVLPVGMNKNVSEKNEDGSESGTPSKKQRSFKSRFSPSANRSGTHKKDTDSPSKQRANLHAISEQQSKKIEIQDKEALKLVVAAQFQKMSLERNEGK